MAFFIRFLKRIVPYLVRLRYRLLKRWLSDSCNFTIFKLAKTDNTALFIQKKQHYKIENTFELKQPILYTPQSASKVVNIQIAATRINTTMLQPKQIFSFWQIVGQPTAAKGYQKGRNIIDGQLVEDVGGGLCQLASILYHTALLAGLPITERYNHSIDIYTHDSERFTPLGADATVVFGFKDLRFRNDFPFPIAFEIEVLADTLVCRLWASAQITPKIVLFTLSYLDNKQLKVATTVEHKEVAHSFYQR